MILVAAVFVWLLIFLYITFAPRCATSPTARRNAQYDALAFGALGVLTAGFFWQLLFTPNTFMPAGGGDLAGFLYPTYHFAQEWLTRGVIPLWNPHIFGGAPFVGDIQSALFYPFNLLTYFLSNPLQYRDLQYLSVLHFYIAGAGMFALLRYGWLTDDRQLNRVACLAGALAFAFSDLFITHFGNLNLIASAAWLPLVFLFFLWATRAAATKTPASAANHTDSRLQTRTAIVFATLSGIFLAISFFAGHIQPFLFIVLTLALYAGYGIVTNRARWQHIAFVFILTLGVGIGLSALTFLPALELTQQSVRSAFTYENAAQFSLPPLQLVGMLVPGFFGRGPENAWGPWSRVEVGYLGIFPLLLAFFAVVLRRNAKTMFFVFIALVGLLLALGGYAILHGWLFQFVPGFGQLRAPARFVFLFDFGLAVLAAIGFDALVSPMNDAQRETFRRVVRAGAWVALCVALVSGALALGILILGQGQDPALFQRIANAANGIGFFILLLAFSFALLLIRAREWLDTRVWSLLAVALIFFDLFSLGAYVDVGHSDPTLGYQRADIVEFLKNNTGLARIDSRTDVEGLWRPDTGLLYRLQDVYGDNPLVLNDFNTYWENVGGRDSNAYQLLNVKYVLTRRGTPMPPNFLNVFEGGGGITVWENRTAAPRAWIATDANVSGDAIQISNVPTSGPEITITGYGPNEIVAQVNASQNSYLIFSEVFVSGWRAFVDGREVTIVRANNLFRAIPISAGAHQVRMVYEPLSFRVGATISAITALIIITTFGVMFFQRRNKK